MNRSGSQLWVIWARSAATARSNANSRSDEAAGSEDCSIFGVFGSTRRGEVRPDGHGV